MQTSRWSLSDTASVFARTANHGRDRVLKSTTLNVLVLCLLVLVGQVVESFMLMPFILPQLIEGVMSGNTTISVNDLTTPGFTLAMLYLCAVAIGFGFLYCLVIERRTARSMGFTKRYLLRDYGLGFVLGIAMMAAAVGLACLGGGLRYEGMTLGGQIGMLLAFLLAWMIQGLSEEVTFRGFFMVSVGANRKPWTAVFVSAVLFASAHLLNPGVTVFAVINLVLYGVFAALYFLRTDSIWGIGALHAMWNCAQGNLFGIQVSGADVGVRVLSFSAADDKTWLTGGAFGLEGGAAVTTVLVVGIVILLLLPQRKSKDSPVAPVTGASVASATPAEPQAE